MGGGKGGSSSPAPVPAPDPAATARAQAEANRITQFTPNGNIIFGNLTDASQLGDLPPGFVPNLSDDQAALFVQPTDTQQQIQSLAEQAGVSLAGLGAQNAANLPGAPLSFDGLPAFQSSLDMGGFVNIPGSQPLPQRPTFNTPEFINGAEIIGPQFDTRQVANPDFVASNGLPEFITEDFVSGQRGTGRFEQFDPTNGGGVNASGGHLLVVDENTGEVQLPSREIMEDVISQRTIANPDFVPSNGLPQFIDEQFQVGTGPTGEFEQIRNPEFDAARAQFEQELAAFEAAQRQAQQGVYDRGGLPGFPGFNQQGQPQFGTQSNKVDTTGQQTPTFGTFNGPFDQRSRVEQATFDRAARLLTPEFQRQEDRLSQTLANRGHVVGGEGFNAEVDSFNRNRNDIMANLAQQAVTAGAAEDSRLFGQQMNTRGQQLAEALQTANMNNQARATGFAEQAAVRSNQFNELASLLGLNQVQSPGVGQFVPPGAVDVLGAQNAALSAQLGNAQLAQQAAAQRSASGASTFNSLLGLGGTLGAGAIMKSSRTLKTEGEPVNVDEILEKVEALPVEEWRYLHDTGTPHIGTFAEDFAEAFEVGDDTGSIHTVDITGVLLASVQALAKRVKELEG